MIQKILVVDDEPEILLDLADMLRHHGFEVSTAVNAEEFEREFFKNLPELIILDIFLGMDSGPDVYDHIMKMDSAPKTPVAFLSGKCEITPESPLMKGRQVALYAKPLSVERLVQDIRAAFADSVAA